MYNIYLRNFAVAEAVSYYFWSLVYFYQSFKSQRDWMYGEEIFGINVDYFEK